MVIIRRYKNRKLYCATTGKYVTLHEVSQLAASGQEVIIIDNTNKVDITKLTMLKAKHAAEIKEATNA
jgi:polyhydroxyalkanoate synthesis regulator protein